MFDGGALETRCCPPPLLIDYDVARLSVLATFAVDMIVCLASACGAEKSADWRVNASGFRCDVVQGVGLEVLPHFPGVRLPGSAWAADVLWYCVTLDWCWRPSTRTLKSSFRRETVSALRCSRWRSVVGVVVRAVVAAAVFEHILRDTLESTSKLDRKIDVLHTGPYHSNVVDVGG